MADTSSSTEPDIDKLQKEIIQSIEYFSKISKIKVKDNNFIQKKINEISKQRVEFRKFAEKSILQNVKMRDYAEELIVFAECCEDDIISNEELLELLRSVLSNIKSNKSEAILLKKQIERIKNSLGKISEKIFKYNEKITKQRKDLPKKIDNLEKVEEALVNPIQMGWVLIGFDAITSVVARRTSSIDHQFFKLAQVVTFGGMLTAMVSSIIFGTSMVAICILDYQLKSAREEFSQYIQEIQDGLENIAVIISYCESHWENQAIKIGRTIKKLEQLKCGEQRIKKVNARLILKKAKDLHAKSEEYDATVRLALTKDKMLA